MKIVFNIKFVAKTSNIKKFSENIKFYVITSKAPSLFPAALFSGCEILRKNFDHKAKNKQLFFLKTGRNDI